MNKYIFSILEPDNPLVNQAMDAFRRYHEAQAAKLSDAEVERLRVAAESLFQAVSEFQQRVMGLRDVNRPWFRRHLQAS